MKKIFVIIFVIIGILSILALSNLDYIKLKAKGYSNSDIAIFKDNLDKNDIEIILSNKYTNKLVKIIKNNDFKKENLNKYINYSLKYNDVNKDDIIIICNNNLDNIDYNENITKFVINENSIMNNINRYINYQLKYNTDINNTIWLVNNNIDEKDENYNNNVLGLINEKYFIKNNLERYLNYYNNNQNKSINEIITNVNSNLDYEYYTNIQSTDLSKGYLLIVNKYYKLDSNYTPDNLVKVENNLGQGYLEKETYEHFVLMANDAKKEGLTLLSASPYRSYATQKYLYNDYVKRNGQMEADTYSARPGHSEHQTGLAVDIKSNLSGELMRFETTKEAKWLSENAYKYGFILRYPKGKEHITGYIYESWHYRYVGVETAKKIKEEDITYEEYYAYYLNK